MNAYLEFIYIYIYCLYFNPLTLNPSSVLAPSHMRRVPYVRGATGRVLLLEDLINFLTCTYRSSQISILKEKKLINPTNHTCFKSIVNKAKPFFFYGLLLLLLQFQVRKTLPIIMSTHISTYIKEKSLHLHYSFCILLFILSLCILRIKEKSRQQLLYVKKKK